MRRAVLLILVLVLLAAGIFFALRPRQAGESPGSDQGTPLTNLSNQEPTRQPAATTAPAAAGTTFAAQDVAGSDPVFQFSAIVPAGWQVEAVAASQALNLYDPTATGATNLEKSKIFVKYFRASSFLTLQTVTVKSRTESTINGRPAVTYLIEKKSGVANFPNQPSWRNREHRVTDIRSSDASPTTFYVFAKAPEVSDATFDAFLNSVTVGQETSVRYPLNGFLERITKKRFGQLITPATSPVQPERFSGYHTGVDAETSESEADVDLPVYAVADGTIRQVTTASGYGGVVLIEHQVAGQTVTALYGHVRRSSVAKRPGQTVTAGEQIAVLGTGNSAETDGERKHLHFGLLKGRSTNLRGYVNLATQLSTWLDPVSWFDQHRR